MPHHVLETPLTEAQARALKVGDTVTLERTLFGIRDGTLIAMFDRGRETRLDLAGHALIHTAPNVRKMPVSNEHPTGYAPLCIGTTTSQRLERYGPRLIIGKGGMGPQTLAAFGDLGGAYLAVVGGAAALQTTWIEAIEDVDLDDLHPESLWRFRIKGFGPLMVAMDSHGGSLYARVQGEATARRDAILAGLGASD